MAHVVAHWRSDAAIEAVSEGCQEWRGIYGRCEELINELPSVTQKSGKWIPVSERLPEDLEPVNITWVNHNPERYYEEIKDKPFTATGHYYKGRWYWYSCTCQDYLEEYGRCDFDEIDMDIEVIAWMPLPEPYESQESEVNNG